MFVLGIMSHTRVLFLDAGGAGLEGGEVHLVGTHERLGHRDDVRDQAVEEVEGHAFSDYDAEDLGFVFGGWEWVVWYLAS